MDLFGVFVFVFVFVVLVIGLLTDRNLGGVLVLLVFILFFLFDHP
jgi:hypothetical protein